MRARIIASLTVCACPIPLALLGCPTEEVPVGDGSSGSSGSLPDTATTTPGSASGSTTMGSNPTGSSGPPVDTTGTTTAVDSTGPSPTDGTSTGPDPTTRGSTDEGTTSSSSSGGSGSTESSGSGESTAGPPACANDDAWNTISTDWFANFPPSSGNLQRPYVSMTTYGHFAVSWWDDDDNTTYVRRYASDGAEIDLVSVGFGHFPAIAMDDGGNLAALGRIVDEATLRIFDAAGIQTVGPVNVWPMAGIYTAHATPVFGEDGALYIALRPASPPELEGRAWVAAFALDGTQLVGWTEVSAAGHFAPEGEPIALAPIPGGGVLVGWRNELDLHLYARTVSPAGILGLQFDLDGGLGAEGGASLAYAEDGTLAAAWMFADTAWVRFYDGAGVPQADPIGLGPDDDPLWRYGDRRVARLPDGTTFVGRHDPLALTSHVHVLDGNGVELQPPIALPGNSYVEPRIATAGCPDDVVIVGEQLTGVADDEMYVWHGHGDDDLDGIADACCL